MKRCPECRRDYYDETLSYCLDDGSPLVGGPATDEPATAVLSSIDLPSEAPTKDFDAAQNSSDANTDDGRTKIAQPNRRVLLLIGLAVVLVTGTFLAYRYLPFTEGKQIESIAVMPFVNESGNADVEYLSDGMTETLIASLSQLPNLNVKARSSVFRYKGKGTDAQTIGKELNVQAILNGRVIQRGQDLILNVELIDAQTENVLWTENYSRQMMNLLSLQRDIARDVSNKLQVKLSGADEQKLAKTYTANPEAYQLYLKGRFSWYKRTEKDIQRSREYIQQAISLDPNYALAYAALADTYASTPIISIAEPAQRHDRLSKAREAALKALSLDNNLAEAHTALGTVLTSFDFDFAGGEREYRRAIQLNPNYAEAHYWYALLLSRLGREQEASAEIERAVELEPLNLVYQANYGGLLAWSRRYDEAIVHLVKTLELDRNFGPTLGNLTNAYWMKGSYAKTIETRAREMELNGNNQDAARTRAALARGGWEGYLRYMTGDNRPAYTSLYLVALCHAALGEKDKAFAALNQSYENRETVLQRLKVDPRLDPLRGDPRFQELLKKVGFPE